MSDNVFCLKSQSYVIGDKVRLVYRTGEYKAARITRILGRHVSMRLINESELGKEVKVFPVSD